MQKTAKQQLKILMLQLESRSQNRIIKKSETNIGLTLSIGFDS